MAAAGEVVDLLHSPVSLPVANYPIRALNVLESYDTHGSKVRLRPFFLMQANPIKKFQSFALEIRVKL